MEKKTQISSSTQDDLNFFMFFLKTWVSTYVMGYPRGTHGITQSMSKDLARDFLS
jgi:hypothetical protein